LVSLKEQKAFSTLLIVVIVLAAVVVAAGAVIIYFWFIPGELITQELEYSDFTAVDVSSAFQVEITQSSSYRVAIIADEKIFDKINVTKTGNTLIIRAEPNILIMSVYKAEITMPNIAQLVLSGASKGTIEGFSTSAPFTTEVSGASQLEMQDINVGNVEIQLSGASTLNGEGSGKDLSAIVEGASNMDLANFPVNDGDLNISGASKTTVNLYGTLNAVVSGASTLYYIGEPTLGNIETSGASTVNKK
jgi:hypothetical protein